MKTRLIIQFSGWHENGTRTEKKFTILNIEGEVTMEIVIKTLNGFAMVGNSKPKSRI